MHGASRLKHGNHFLPVCYQKSFADSSGRVWVKFASQEKPQHLYPRSVGVKRNLYVRKEDGLEDDKFEDFFNKHIENPFAQFCKRVEDEQDKLKGVTSADLAALAKFVASQIVRTRANKHTMEVQVGRELSTKEFLAEMGKQMSDFARAWETSFPSIQFYTSLPFVEERFITGDDPVAVVREHANTLWTPTEDRQQAFASLQNLLNDGEVSFRVAISPYVCVFLHGQGDVEPHLPARTIEPPAVRRFNDFIRRQCNLFTLARDKESLT